MSLGREFTARQPSSPAAGRCVDHLNTVFDARLSMLNVDWPRRQSRRVGLVFGIESRASGESLDVQMDSQIFSKIGKRANVVVSQDGGG